MPCLLEELFVISHDVHDDPQFVCGEAVVPRESGRAEPELGFITGLFHMNMDRFVSFVREKEEAIPVMT
jgi:hypothetical protein